MNSKELKTVLEDHQLWLYEEGGKHANLSGADLRGADLRGVNLSGATLRFANVSCANLSGATLRFANLSCADLSCANLSCANLSCADLSDANLSDANLSDANLSDADLSDANLSDANLSDANLWNSIGNRREIKSILVAEEYSIVYTADYLQIGCERHKITDWWDFDDERIFNMDGEKALKFWEEWKNLIKKIIEKSPAR
ncbi:MAG: pentapeptide repeat-containing protein [Pseudomonas sp.]|nr:pentapeptide repeat-containing protein [Pseudomonas sp.]